MTNLSLSASWHSRRALARAYDTFQARSSNIRAGLEFAWPKDLIAKVHPFGQRPTLKSQVQKVSFTRLQGGSTKGAGTCRNPSAFVSEAAARDLHQTRQHHDAMDGNAHKERDHAFAQIPAESPVPRNHAPMHEFLNCLQVDAADMPTAKPSLTNRESLWESAQRPVSTNMLLWTAQNMPI